MAFLTPGHWGSTIAALDPKFIPLSHAKDRYWNILYMEEVTVIAQGIEWKEKLMDLKKGSILKA
jgi:hypothetical protein